MVGPPLGSATDEGVAKDKISPEPGTESCNPDSRLNTLPTKTLLYPIADFRMHDSGQSRVDRFYVHILINVLYGSQAKTGGNLIYGIISSILRNATRTYYQIRYDQRAA